MLTHFAILPQMSDKSNMYLSDIIIETATRYDSATIHAKCAN